MRISEGFADSLIPTLFSPKMAPLLLDLLNILVTWPPKLVKMIEKGKELKERKRMLEESLNNMDMKMSVYGYENERL